VKRLAGVLEHGADAVPEAHGLIIVLDERFDRVPLGRLPAR